MLLKLGNTIKTPDGREGKIVMITQPDHDDPILSVFGDDFLVNISCSKLRFCNMEVDNRDFQNGEGI